MTRAREALNYLKTCPTDNAERGLAPSEGDVDKPEFFKPMLTPANWGEFINAVQTEAIIHDFKVR